VSDRSSSWFGIGILRRVATLRVDLWEVVLVLLLAAALLHPLVSTTTTAEAELAPYRERFGPHHQSENEEEWFIRDFFADRRDGVFVDVGANHPKRFSKTWYLEKELGWSGIAVEPLRQFQADYETERPRTKFRPFFVSHTSDETAKLYVISGDTVVSSGDPAFTGAFGTVDRVDTVPTITLDDLLTREGVTRIDFMNIDIELHEPAALRGFDIRRFAPGLVCIEALPPTRQAILEYFARNGYVIVGKYLRADQENLYFTPLPATNTTATPSS
jgi:FkbM family methyltransferase